MRPSLPTLTLSLLLSAGAFAQSETAGKTLVDQWVERYSANVKVAYGRYVLKERAGGGFVEEQTQYSPISGGTFVHTVRTETDATGRIVRRDLTDSIPAGKTTLHVEAAGENLRWRIKLRKLPEQKGEVSGPVYDTDVVSYLYATGKKPLGKTTLEVLDLPQGTKTKAVDATQAGDRIRVATGDTARLFGPGGKLIEVRRSDAVGLSLPVSEAQAKDMSRTPEHPQKAPGLSSPGAYGHRGVTLKSPADPGWMLMVPLPGKKPLLGLIHPLGVGVMVLPIPAALPEEEAARVMQGKRFMSAVNQNPNGMALSNPTAVTAWGLPAVQYDVTAPLGVQRTKGRGWLLRQAPKRALMVLLLHPVDLETETAVQVEAARNALSIKKLAAPATRLHLKPGDWPFGLHVPVPADWKRSATKQGHVTWNSPAGSQVGAWLTSTQLDPHEAADQWTKATAPRFKVPAPPAKAVKVGPRDAWGTTLSVSAPNGASFRLRLIVAPSGEAGKVVMMMVVAGADLDPATVDTLLSGSTWK